MKRSRFTIVGRLYLLWLSVFLLTRLVLLEPQRFAFHPHRQQPLWSSGEYEPCAAAETFHPLSDWGKCVMLDGLCAKADRESVTNQFPIV